MRSPDRLERRLEPNFDGAPSTEDAIHALQQVAQTCVLLASLLRSDHRRARVLTRNPIKVRGGRARVRNATRDERGRFLRALGSELDK